MNYEELLDCSTKKKILYDIIEDKNNSIIYALRDMSDEQAVKLLEKLYESLCEIEKGLQETSKK